MKKLLMLTLGAIFAINLSVNAQMPSPEEMAKKQTEMLKKELKLNDKQEKQVKAEFLGLFKFMQELMSSGSDRDTMMKKMQERQGKFMKALEKILTKEQMKKYKELAAKHRRR